MTLETLLVVDDEPDMRFMLEVHLGGEGIAVVTVPCGLDALAALESSRFDVVLLDVHMPGMSGRETLAEIRRRWRSQPVVVMSSALGAGSGENTWERAADGLLVKPFDLDVLVAALRAAAARGGRA